MKNIFLFLLMFIISVTPFIAQDLQLDQGTTRAVVIGISEYQEEGIPNLKYAHKDAEEFVAFLKSPTGGALSDDQIILLTNENATTGQITVDLGWLIEESRPGDKAIIYFSGHSDVERITRFQRGYLLTYDSPSNTYNAGAFSMSFLQDVITSLSDENVTIIMISDACRAGKLTGSEIGGTQAASSVLAKQFANEIKIMSCQANEFSLEGEQWGGGRGAFSYHLIDGLYGFADDNSDLQINLKEISRYLEDKVSSETAPHNQNPFTVGDRMTHLSLVDQNLLVQLISKKKRELPEISSIEPKGIEKEMMGQIDSSFLELYKQFLAATESGNLLEPKDSCAYDLYLVLSKEESLKPYHGLMKRNLAAALQDDAQQAINAYLKADSIELANMYNNDKKYKRYPEYLSKAADILGPDTLYLSILESQAVLF